MTTMAYDGNRMVSQTYQNATTHLVSYFSYDGDGNILTISRYTYVGCAATDSDDVLRLRRRRTDRHHDARRFW